jgi:hypothetical protein
MELGAEHDVAPVLRVPAKIAQTEVFDNLPHDSIWEKSEILWIFLGDALFWEIRNLVFMGFFVMQAAEKGYFQRLRVIVMVRLGFGIATDSTREALYFTVPNRVIEYAASFNLNRSFLRFVSECRRSRSGFCSRQRCR